MEHLSSIDYYKEILVDWLTTTRLTSNLHKFQWGMFRPLCVVWIPNDIHHYPSIVVPNPRLNLPHSFHVQVPCWVGNSNGHVSIFFCSSGGSEEISCHKHESRIEMKGPPGYKETSLVTGNPAAVKAMMGTATRWPGNGLSVGYQWEKHRSKWGFAIVIRCYPTIHSFFWRGFRSFWTIPFLYLYWHTLTMYFPCFLFEPWTIHIRDSDNLFMTHVGIIATVATGAPTAFQAKLI